MNEMQTECKQDGFSYFLLWREYSEHYNLCGHISYWCSLLKLCGLVDKKKCVKVATLANMWSSPASLKCVPEVSSIQNSWPTILRVNI